MPGLAEQCAILLQRAHPNRKLLSTDWNEDLVNEGQGNSLELHDYWELEVWAESPK